ncbi:trypsin-like peptidase domain-containing protein [Streptomyces sp. NBC_00005]|uniref:S1C family serine protease n=1 Tax=Streptomyces sp. NBC_00005 TaxID=2903609 RepID=UPI003247D74C
MAATTPDDGVAAAARDDDIEGDFELDRPAGLRGEGTVPSEGDFELRRPQDVSGAEAGGGLAVAPERSSLTEPSDEPGTEGDFVLDRPAATPVTHLDSAPAAAPTAERPRPLHDPDPYSTPPYGGPGPWAPAPPVQHPAATPAQGTAIPTPSPAHGVTAPSPAHGVPTPPPAHGLPTPSPAHGVPPSPAHAAAMPPPAPAVPTPSPAHAAPAPPSTHGVPTPSPAHAAPAPPSTHGVPTPSPAHAAATPPPAPAALTPQPPNAEPTPAPHSPHGMPTPAPLAGAPAPTIPSPHGAPVPAQLHGVPAQLPTSAAHAPAPTSTAWQNYDPWAPAPLHQNGAAVEGKDGRRRRVKRALVGGAVVLALVAGGVGGAIGAYLERNGGVGAVELPQAGKEPAGRAPDSVAGIAARALPSVVTLHVTGTDESGTGTGFVLDDQGHILTNNHVVEPAAGSTGSAGEISVTFNSGDTAKATVVGRDSGYDLAVVKVSNVRGLKPMPLGNSDNVQVGDPVVAIGAPYDLEGTVTSGIISAKERPITAGGDSADGSDVSYVDALQTDAPINPGNSGGPLLDSRARVIGINSAIRSADDGGSDSGGGQAGSIGLGFAIPVNQAKRVAEELINTGKATHPVIGVTLDMDYTGDGARVGAKADGGGPAVNAGGPGDKAGIKAGDVITAVDGQRVHSGEELIVKTRAHRPGDRLELTVRRDGEEKKISLVLGSSDGS